MQLKKIIAILVIFVCVGTALSAQDFDISVGGGTFLDWGLLGNGMNTTQGDDTFYSRMQNMRFGGYAFLDVTYAEIDVSFAYGMLSTYTRLNKGDKTAGPDSSVLQLGFTLLGKYPVNLGSITVFPLAGIHYNMALSSDPKVYPYEETVLKDDGKTEKIEHKISEMNQFSILVGGGLDYNINKNLYIRFSLLGQLRFASKEMSDVVSALNDIESKKKKAADAAGQKYETISYKTVVGFGPVIKVGVGYRF
jgi:opacity protein-like surface antigen